MRFGARLALAIGLAALLASPGAADDTGTTHVDEVSAALIGSTVAVSGSATFADAATAVGEDPTGDAASPLPGNDLTEATIARPDPSQNTLVFTLDIANQPPAPVQGTPYVIYYNWEVVTAAPGGEPSVTYLLQANRLLGSKLPNTNPTFRVLRYNSSGACGCTETAVVQGTMADGVVQWQVPGSRIEADPGDTITQNGDISATLGYYNPAGGNTWYKDGYMGDTLFSEPYVVPGGQVELSIAPASAPGFPVRTAAATVNADGTFSGVVDGAGLASGDYIVTAAACYGPGSCGAASVPIIIP